MANIVCVRPFLTSVNNSWHSQLKVTYSINRKLLIRILHLTNCKYCTNHPKDNDVDIKIGDIIKEDSHTNLVPRSLRFAGMPHQVGIVQPRIKRRKEKTFITSPQLQLEEGISLIKTLPGWVSVDSKIISLASFEKKTFFNTGQLETVKEWLQNEVFTALFINTKSLKLEQILFLEQYFHVPVFDRYSIIINIFREHAYTKEAKLQVALAEIPYISSRIRGIHENEASISRNVGIGSSETFIDKRFQILNDQKKKIVKAIADLRKKRELLRNKRRILQFPIIAVVGYTNAGKTSLIKCLTKETSLKPEDKLFSTLDVTAHAVELPHSIKALLIDTIGFITDIPTDLLEPFVVTLEDALMADVIIHVKDVSHPDHLAQELHVIEILKKLNISHNTIENIITVGNKCDKKQIPGEGSNLHLVSCQTQHGIEDLKEIIAGAVIKAKDMMKIRIKVKNGGVEYQWLLKESAVSEITVDEDQQYVLLDVFITKLKFNKFKNEFT